MAQKIVHPVTKVTFYSQNPHKHLRYELEAPFYKENRWQ
ncbi:MAG: hypothetical protein JWQ54_3617 [Mucilaginibacter sp.]|nr:hypothetical protein [Mucilaginibacter sp.]